MGERFSHVNPTRQFRKLAQTIELLMNTGADDRVIDALLREQIAYDLSREFNRAEHRRRPSEN